MNPPTAKHHDDSPGAAIDWSGIFFDPSNDLPGKLMARARKRFGDSPDAEAAYNYALEYVSAESFALLVDRFAGRGSAGGFLSITFLNAMEEYARQKYPRARPPAWLQRLGGLWVRTWQMLCLQREAIETIVAALGGNTREQSDEVRFATAEIKRRVPGCGQVVAEQTMLDDMSAEPVSDEPTPGVAAERDVALVLLQVLSGVLGQDVSAAQMAASAKLGDAVALSDQERLLLRLVYEEGHAIASAARALDMQRKQASRLHASVLARLRGALKPLGLSE